MECNQAATPMASRPCRTAAEARNAYPATRPALPEIPRIVNGQGSIRDARFHRKGMSQTMMRIPRTDICRVFVANLCLLAGIALSSASVEAQAQRGAQNPSERISASPKEVKFEVISIKSIKVDTQIGRAHV